MGHDVHELGLHPVQLHELNHVGPLRLEQPGVGDGPRRLLREQTEGPKVVFGEQPTGLRVHAQHAEQIVPVHQRHAHRALDRVVAQGQVRELGGIRLPADQQRLEGLRHPAGDAFADPQPTVPCSLVAHDARGHEVVPLDHHDRSALAGQQVGGASQDHLEDSVQLEDGVHGLPRVEQKRDLVQAARQRDREDALVRQEAGELAKVQLLLDRVRAERDREHHHPPPEGGGRQEGTGGAGPHREQGDRGADRHQQDGGEDPQLHPPVLHGLQGGRAEVAQAHHPGLAADAVRKLRSVLGHGSLLGLSVRGNPSLTTAGPARPGRLGLTVTEPA